MAISPLAGKIAPKEMLINVGELVAAYYASKPDMTDTRQWVAFGTSGHRGTSLDHTFTEMHILAISQAIVDYRQKQGVTGPLMMGMDTHALSVPAQQTALEVLAANGVETWIQWDGGFTPTPVISWAILTHNKGKSDALADGIVITPSHNPPGDGGFKYNAINGGPADTDATGWIQNQANNYLKTNNAGVKRVAYAQALAAGTTVKQDFVERYVADLPSVIEMGVIRDRAVKIGVDPLGGASLAYWRAIKKAYGLNLTIVNETVDPTFSFMPVDHDGKIRMDCSSPYAMAGLVKMKDAYAVAVGNDPDSDRHGIITPGGGGGLMNPNHYLAVAIEYLLGHRSLWKKTSAIGKTVVSSSMIDRVVEGLDRVLMEVPVGFKWFAPGLFDGTICFGGEESAGASFLRKDGTAWSTDKDGIIMALLAAEMTATTGEDPGVHYAKLTAKYGSPFYARVDAPATPEQKAAFKKLTPDAVKAGTLAGDAILSKLTNAPGNHASIGGLKVTTKSGWFAARPSGTENIYKVYAESFVSAGHLDEVIREAQGIVNAALAG
jgi:phosphoglucomutase